MPQSLILTTCWYPVGAKFGHSVYETWIDNILSTVVNYKLVVYTDQECFQRWSQVYSCCPNLHFVMYPLEEFELYRKMGVDFWIHNHNRNNCVNSLVHWKVNLIWCQKVWLVERTAQMCWFGENAQETWYGWVDIGYFRCRLGMDVPKQKLVEIPAQGCLERLDQAKIHYLLVNRNDKEVNRLKEIVARGLFLPDNQISFGGGCFLLYGDLQATRWREMFDDMFQHYVECGHVVKDDQVVVSTCIFREWTRVFEIHRPPNNYSFDPWFYMTAVLLQ